MGAMGSAGGNTSTWMVLAVVLALGVGGCGGQSEVSGDTYTIYVHDGSLLPRGGEDALVQGTLTTWGGCVMLQQEGFDHLYPVVWPSGTSIASENPLTLRLPSGEELTLGQAVSGGGGYHDESSPRLDDVDIPFGCLPESGEMAVFNPDADLLIVEGPTFGGIPPLDSETGARSTQALFRTTSPTSAAGTV